MLSISKIRLVLAALLMVAMTGVTTGPSALAHGNGHRHWHSHGYMPRPVQSNGVTFNISGGNVSAIATCLNNVARGGNNVQANQCNNYAIARGNTIIIRNVHINAVQGNSGRAGNPAQGNTINFTVNGGNVSAVASCVNNAGKGGGNVQVNLCVNNAIAIGNTIVLINVHIDSVQVNG
jgi:hypothetical protein